MKNLLQLVWLALAITIKTSSSLKCYNCVYFECPHQDQMRCDEMEEAALAVASKWFQTPLQKATRCPDLDQPDKWKMLESSSQSECNRDSKACAMMRFEVRTYNEAMVKAFPEISYGTIIGCDTPKRRELFPTVLTTASRQEERCVFEVKNFRKDAHSPYIQRIFYENCAGARCRTSKCNTCFTDFCTNKTGALPKRFEFQDTETSTRSWAVAMLVFMIVLVGLLSMEDLHLLQLPSVGVRKFYGENIEKELRRRSLDSRKINEFE